MAMDIAREEEALKDVDRQLVNQAQLLQAQQEHEERGIAALQEKMIKITSRI